MQSNPFLSIAALAVAAGQSLSVLPTTSTTAVTFRLHEDANAPDGETQRYQHVVLMRRSDGYDAVISSAGQPDATISLKLRDGNLAPRDAATPDDQKSTIEPLGFLVILADHQLLITEGQSWTTTTTVDLPGGDAVTIPLSVTATNVRGDNVSLAATGSGDGVVHGHGHTAKANVKLSLQASFQNGRVVSATTTRTVTVHVIFRTITLTDVWSVAT